MKVRPVYSKRGPFSSGTPIARIKTVAVGRAAPARERELLADLRRALDAWEESADEDGVGEIVEIRARWGMKVTQPDPQDDAE